jgi:hypothetical protein
MSKARQQMPDLEARQSILQAIEAADGPVTAATLCKLPGIGSRARVKPLLTEEVATGRVFDWGKSAYWHLDPEHVARGRLLELAAREFLKPAELKKRVAQASPKIKSTTVQSVIKKLVAEKRFLPKEAKTASISGMIDLNHPEPYLERKIAAVLKSVGIERSPDRICALLAPETEPHSQSSPSTDVHEVAEKMFAAMNRIAFGPGTTVTFYLLRQQPELAVIPKQLFDQAALLLQQERRALLSAHGYAGSISAQERDQLVTDGFGNYYVSIYAR